MILTLNNLIVDINLLIDAFPLEAQALAEMSWVDIGPGGACNVAIMASRLGAPVGVLGEVGADRFGRIIQDGLARERVDTSHIIIDDASRTPVVGVIVDGAGEPAYLGYGGTLHVRTLPDVWRTAIASASALFVDGWIEDAALAELILDALRTARRHDVPAFFDPGPGNPRHPLAWHREAAALSTVVLLNSAEARRLTGDPDPVAAARTLLANGADLIFVKRGADGCMAVSGADATIVDAPGLPVDLADATGAGDSLAGAVLAGYLRGLPPADLVVLGNAAGAAKVQKRGAGHNVPTRDEVAAVLTRFGYATSLAQP